MATFIKYLILIFYTFILFFSLIAQSSFASMPAYKVEWKENQRAVYYLIIIDTKVKIFRIKTRNHYVFLEEPIHRIGIWAYDAENAVIERPKITVTDLKLSKELEVAKADALKKVKSKLIQKKKVVKPPPDKETIAEIKFLEELTKENEEAFKSPPFRFLDLNLGLGQETITAQGGSSVFNGSAPISQIELNCLLIGHKLSANSKWKFRADFKMHTFSFQEEEQFGSEDNRRQLTIIKRNQLSAQGEYELLEIKKKLRGFFVFGWAATTHASLTRDRLDSDNKELEARFINSPVVGLSLEWLIKKKNYLISYLVSSHKLASSMPTYKGWEWEIRYLQFLAEPIYINYLGTFKKETLTYNSHCKTSSSTCFGLGLTESSTVQLGIGAGITF